MGLDNASDPAGHGKHRLLRLSLVAFSTLLCCVLGEAVVRVFFGLVPNYEYEMWRYASELKQPWPSSVLPFHHFPNKSGTYYGVEIRTNSMGLRDVEHRVPKPSGVKRILFLGDSFTLGWGVPFEDVFTRQIGRQLGRSGGRFDVVNMGIGNYNSSMEVELFKRKGLALEPDIVVLMYFVNDVEPTPHVSRFQYRLFRASYLVAYLYERIRLLRNSEERDPARYYRKIYSPSEPALEMNSTAIRELARMCRARGMSVLVVSIPDMRSLRNYPYAFATDYIRSLAEDSHLPFLDLLTVFAKQQAASLWVSPADPHMNAEANTLAARAIYETLLHEHLLR